MAFCAADGIGIYTDTSGTMSLLVKNGDAAPGIAGASFFGIDHPVCGGAEQVAFIGTVTGGGTTAGTDDKGIWRTAANGGTLALVIRTGDTMTTTLGVKTIADVDLPGSSLDERRWDQPVMDGTGRLIIYVTFTDGSTSQVLAP